MNRKTRLLIAAIVTLILAVTATTVWASSNAKKEGSLGHKIHEKKQACNTLIHMGDATFQMFVAGKAICSFTVIRTKVPNTQLGILPVGQEYRSDGFEVSGGPADGIGMLEVCFAYSPQDEKKNSQIYALFGTQTTTLPTVKAGTPSKLCAATPILNGCFAMIGDK